MREIEFRGKDVITLKWVYGVPVKATTNFSNEYIEMVEKIEYETDLEYSTFVCSKTIKPETIGQYTGLIDKKGKMIFEGDIVRVSCESYTEQWNDIGVVKYFKSAFGVSFENEKHFLYFNNMSMYVRGCEVIGNIYDNPELVEGDNEN